MSRRSIPCVCETCKKTFLAVPHQTGRWCSIACMPKVGKITLICKNCNESFQRWPSVVKHGGGAFCSERCRDGHWARNRPPKGYTKGTKRACPCGKVFWCNRAWARRHKSDEPIYCSWECRRLHKNVERTCEQCGSKFTVAISSEKFRFCNMSCYGRWISENYHGANHHSWRGGCSKKRGHEWRCVRLEALKRDGYCCRLCGRGAKHLGSGKIHVHHIVKYRHTKDNSLGNLVTLCQHCHPKVDQGTVEFTPQFLASLSLETISP
jgi:hypothetical protein